jgi:hypothetical protein
LETIVVTGSARGVVGLTATPRRSYVVLRVHFTVSVTYDAEDVCATLAEAT